MSTANLDHFDLSQVDLNGEVNEDVLQQLIRVEEWDNPLLAMAGGRSVGNKYYEWTTRDYAAPLLNNQRVDGDDAGADESRTGIRVGNHVQILDKTLRVSEMAQGANTIARANELALQIQERGVELLRDCEAQFASNNASVAGTDTVAGVSAGLVAWLVNRDIQDTVATGVIQSVASAGASTDGGWINRTGNTVPGRDFAGVTPGAITETAIKDACQAIYEQGGNATTLLAKAGGIRKMSEFFFSDGARIGTLESQIPQGNRGGAAAQGRVNVWVSDFSILRLVPDRNLVTTDSGTGSETVYILDPGNIRKVDFQGLRLNNLAKTGTADNRQLVWKGGFQVDAWPKCGLIVDADFSLDMTA
jgi:hypothetical protein